MVVSADPRRSQAPAWALAGLVTVTGITHFVLPGFYDAIIPTLLPGPARAWTYASGVAELACAATIAHPATRRLGTRATAILFVAVFPANIQMAINWRHRGGLEQAIAYARLPLQIPLVAWAVWAGRRAGASRS